MNTPADTIEPSAPVDPPPTEPGAAASLLVIDSLNLLVGALLVYTGLLDKLWQSIKPPMHWRTGPPAQGTLIYIALIALGWLMFNVVLIRLAHIARSALGHPPPSTLYCACFERLTLRAARFIVSAAIVIVVQLLMLPLWPLLAALLLLPGFLLTRADTPLLRRLLNWIWCVMGIALAGLLIHRAFLADPRFIPRLAMILTAWRIIGKCPPLNLMQSKTWTPDWAG